MARFIASRPAVRPWVPVAAVAMAASVLAGCGSDEAPIDSLSSFAVTVTAVDGNPLPALDAPLPANLGNILETWDFTIQARDADGRLEPFDGMVRLSVRPGAVWACTHETGARGATCASFGGEASGRVVVTAVTGRHLWVEDFGYLPAEPAALSACEYGQATTASAVAPQRSGCAFADAPPRRRHLAAGSRARALRPAPPLRCRVALARPIPQGIEVAWRRAASGGDASLHEASTSPSMPEEVAADTTSSAPSNSTPPGCASRRRTASRHGEQFFGFPTSSPSSAYLPDEAGASSRCRSRASSKTRQSSTRWEKEKLEASWCAGGLHVATSRPGPVVTVPGPNPPAANQGDGDGISRAPPGQCSDVSRQPYCRGTAYSGAALQGLARAAGTTPPAARRDCGDAVPARHRPDPDQHRPCPPRPRANVAGIDAVSGTMRNFSGGSLNWTIEARCPDDLACTATGCGTGAPVSSKTACVRLRTEDDNEQGTN